LKATISLVAGLAALVLLASSSCAGESSGVAGAAAYMSRPYGARPIGLGGAFTAVSDDASALQYNPGALGRIEGTTLQASYASMSMNRTPYQGVVVWNAGASGTFGVGLTGLRISDIDGRDAEGNPADAFDSSEMAVTAGYGRAVGPWLGLGASFKYMMQTLQDNSGSGFGFDVGAHSRFEIDTPVVDMLSLGIAISNIGSKLKWDTDSSHEDDLLMTSRYGVAVGATPNEAFRIVATAEGAKTGDRDIELCLGGELWYTETFALRVGHNDEDVVFGLSGATERFRLDYAYAPDTLDEGASHWLSLNVRM